MLNVRWLFYVAIGAILCFNILQQEKVRLVFSKPTHEKRQNDVLRSILL